MNNLPECPDCTKAIKRYWAIESRMARRGNFGIVPALPYCKKHKLTISKIK